MKPKLMTLILRVHYRRSTHRTVDYLYLKKPVAPALVLPVPMTLPMVLEFHIYSHFPSPCRTHMYLHSRGGMFHRIFLRLYRPTRWHWTARQGGYNLSLPQHLAQNSVSMYLCLYLQLVFPPAKIKVTTLNYASGVKRYNFKFHWRK